MTLLKRFVGIAGFYPSTANQVSSPVLRPGKFSCYRTWKLALPNYVIWPWMAFMVAALRSTTRWLERKGKLDSWTGEFHPTIVRVCLMCKWNARAGGVRDLPVAVFRCCSKRCVPQLYSGCCHLLCCQLWKWFFQQYIYCGSIPENWSLEYQINEKLGGVHWKNGFRSQLDYCIFNFNSSSFV